MIGGASGIGRATAIRLAGRGDAVGVFDLSGHGAEETVGLINAAGGRARVITGDVASSQDVRRAVTETVEEFGPLTGAVANAGIEVEATVLTTTEETWQRSLDVMLTGCFLTARHTLPYLIEQNGTFVATASDAGVSGYQNWAPYVAAKHGVIGLVRAMALDHGPEGVRSCAVCPGWTATPMIDRVLTGVQPEVVAEHAASIPLGRFATPEVIADVIAHLSSDQARHTNGLIYVVDGGVHVGPFERAAASHS